MHDRSRHRGWRRGSRIALVSLAASGCVCSTPAAIDIGAVLPVVTQVVTPPPSVVETAPAVVLPPPVVSVTAAGEVDARDGLRVDLIGPAETFVERGVDDESPGASPLALIVRIENTADEPRWLVTGGYLGDRAHVAVEGPDARPLHGSDLCDGGSGPLGGGWAPIAPGEHLDIALASIANRAADCTAFGPHWVTPGRYQIRVTLPSVEIRRGTREQSRLIRSRDLVSGSLAIDVREPTTTTPSSTATIEPFVADLWLLRDGDEADDPGRRVAVISTGDTEGPRPDGLAPMGSAVRNETTSTFYRVRDVTPSPIATVTVISIDSTCEARVTRATEARIGSESNDAEELADIEALVLDYEGCIEGGFAAGPGPVVVQTFVGGDDTMFAPAPPAITRAVGASLIGPLRSHALPGTEAFVVGNADRLCLVAHGRSSCDGTTAPYAQVDVGGATFLLLRSDDGDYASPLDAALP